MLFRSRNEALHTISVVRGFIFSMIEELVDHTLLLIGIILCIVGSFSSAICSYFGYSTTIANIVLLPGFLLAIYMWIKIKRRHSAMGLR